MSDDEFLGKVKDAWEGVVQDMPNSLLTHVAVMTDAEIMDMWESRAEMWKNRDAALGQFSFSQSDMVRELALGELRKRTRRGIE
jgi:hypothetical protein